jgi:plasmid stabilization system protein ParE
MNVRLSRRASRQIEEIRDYLLARRPSAASAFLDAMFELRVRLATFPRSAPLIREPNVHQAKVSGFPYVAVYSVASDGVRILTVLHTSRDPALRIRP